jgi:hypothetical protein
MNWQRRLRYINIALAVVLVALVLRLAPQMPWNQPAPPAEAPVEHHDAHDWVDPAKGLKIIMFYATPAVVTRGETAILCYGVANSDRVELDPPVANVAPSLNRCVEVTPTATTTYTLTAANGRGEEQSQALEVTVTGTRAAKPSPAASPEPSTEPRIAYFRLDETTREGGVTFHKLCFRIWNAEQVEVQPAAFPAAKVFQGCFTVAPRSETVYTLTARGKNGAEVSEQLTLAP